jgi:hypothetical protein
MRNWPLSERLDRATLEKLYNEHELTTGWIAERYGSTSTNVILLMKKYGIARRPKGWRRSD